jgi:hypothetical protein
VAALIDNIPVPQLKTTLNFPHALKWIPKTLITPATQKKRYHDRLFFMDGIQKLAKRWQKCVGGDYLEK